MVAVDRKFEFELVSPERLLLSEPVDMAVIPGTEGDFGVLAAHSLLISTLRPGVIEVWQGETVTNRLFVIGGFAEVTDTRCTVLADEAVPVDEIDAIQAQAKFEQARDALTAAQGLKKLQLEMGGKNPQVVLDDADLAQAVELSVQSAFYSTGQRCTASSRLIVTDGIYPRFVAAMQERMARIRVGAALAVGTDIGPVASKSQLEQDLRYIEIGQAEGATLAFGGGLVKQPTEGHFMSPALFTESTPSMRINREEVFGPVASVIRVANYDEALAVANDTAFGLSAGIATTSLKHASHFKRHAQAGMVMVNLPTAGVDYHVPFGGRKGSSFGPREQGAYAKEFYTTVKTAYVLA